MDTFYALNKLLSTLPFSILGYFEHEKELDVFLERLCESDFVSKKDKIELVSYSYAKLETLENWETKSLSSGLFFHALNEKYSLLALNVYYTIRNKLFERGDEEIDNSAFLSNNVAIVLSRLFLKDIGFRLRYTEENDWHFSFLEQHLLFSIQLPLSRLIKTDGDRKDNERPLTVFKKALGKFLGEAIEALNSDGSIKDLILQKADGKNSSYKKYKTDNSPISAKLDAFLTTFRPKAELQQLRDELVDTIYFWHTANPGYLTAQDTRKHIENWVELFFQIVFISLVYDAWVEYFPSICGLEEKAGRKYRNLGGLILGYQIAEGNTLTQEERSIFRIISARISSTVAGQWLFENNILKQIDYHRFMFREFCDILNDTSLNHKKRFTSHFDYLHGRAESKDGSQILKGLLEDYKFSIGEEFIKWAAVNDQKFSKYLAVICAPGREKDSNVNALWKDCQAHFEASCLDKKCVYCRIRDANCVSRELKFYLNLPLICKLINEFELYPEAAPATISLLDGHTLVFSYTNKFNLSGFLTKLKQATTRSLTGFIQQNYYPILAMCDFRIIVTGKHVFDLKSWVLNKTVPSEETVLEDFALHFDLLHPIQ